MDHVRAVCSGYHLVDGAKVYSPEASLTTSTTTIDGFVVPSAPRSLTTLVSPASGVGSGEVHLRWEAPALDGGTPITDYLIERSADGTSEWLPIVDEVSPTRNATVTGLSNGTKVYFRVLAVSEVGTGLASTVVNATPRTVPDAPESLTATPGDGVIQLAWLAPASTGGSSITDYVVERSTDGTSGWVKIEELISSVRSFTVTGLVNGTRAYFRVLAVNEAGRSAASDVVDTVSRIGCLAPTVVDGSTLQCLWAGAALLVGPGLGWGRSDHGLHDRALAQRDVGLADDQRRRARPRPPTRSPVCPTAPATTSAFLPSTPPATQPSPTRPPLFRALWLQQCVR